MKNLLYLLLGAALLATLWTASGSSKDLYSQWKTQHGHNFNGQEDIFRRNIFQQSVKEAEDFNALESQTYEMGINHFSHLSQQEWELLYLKRREHGEATVNVQAPFNNNPTHEDIDWVMLGKVSPVKNQGACDAGYAFSTTGLLESYARIEGVDIILSDQQLVDCSSQYGTSGCAGGSRTGALNFVKENGITTQAAYPYVGTVQTCKAKSGTFRITSYSSATGCEAIGNALRTSPVSIAADATNWRSYRSGIFNNCGNSVTHDVLLVAQTTTFWKIKNSWGLSWGEYGYIRVALGNTCGVCGITAYWPDR